MFRRYRGFTLIELLVVIAIIAILAAILFPVFAQAKAACSQPASVHRSTELVRAHMLYAVDWDGVRPNPSVSSGRASASYAATPAFHAEPCTARDNCACTASGLSGLDADVGAEEWWTSVFAWCVKKVWTDTSPSPCVFYSFFYIDFELVAYHFLQAPVGEPLNPNFVDDYEEKVYRGSDHEISYLGVWNTSGCSVSGDWFHYMYLPAL